MHRIIPLRPPELRICKKGRVAAPEVYRPNGILLFEVDPHFENGVAIFIAPGYIVLF
jgi:hypothetical protein